MNGYSRVEQMTRRVCFFVPAGSHGAPWTEVMKAIRAAHLELWELGRVEQGQDAPDDVIKMSPSDDAVIVFYERASHVFGEEPEVKP